MRHLLDAITQTFPFLKPTPAIAQDLLTCGTLRAIPANTTLYQEGDTCQQIAFLLAGEVRVFKASESGREITLYEIGPGDTCILTASCILSNFGYPANAVTVEPCQALLLPAQEFMRLLETHRPLRTFVDTMLSHRLAAIMLLIEEVVFNRLDRRLFEYLVERSEDGYINRTHQRIANDLGTSREVVTRLLKDFQTRGSIRAGRNRIEILDYQPAHLA